MQGAALLQAAEEAGDAGSDDDLGSDSDSDLGSDSATAVDDDAAESDEEGSEEAASVRSDDDGRAGAPAEDGTPEASGQEAGSGPEDEGPYEDEAGGSEDADVLSNDADAAGRSSDEEQTPAASDRDPDGGSPQGGAADAAQQAALSRKRLPQRRYLEAEAAALDEDEAEGTEDRPAKRRKAGPVSSNRCDLQRCVLSHAPTATLTCMLAAFVPAASGSEPSLGSQSLRGSLLATPLMDVSQS